jgi:magnesium chelatase family protein
VALARTRSVSLEGVRGHVVEIEADIASGLPHVALVGSVDGALTEARDRCRAAVVNSGRPWPQRKITIALSPASLPKAGAHYDLAIAVAVLAAQAEVPAQPLADAVLLGELALDGRLRAVPGVLPATLAIAKAGLTKVLVPEANVVEASQVGGLDVIGARSLRHVVALLRGEDPPDDPAVEPLSAGIDGGWRGEDRVTGLDLSDVRGQGDARFALEVAAAGGHHVRLHGPPGGGKTMLAERLPGLLPDLEHDQSLEVSAVHSVAGVLRPDAPLVQRPPFLDPHHTASLVSVIGGGSRHIRPGAVSLAHHGVLFLDEAPEFPVNVLEVLRQPLESGQIAVSRASRTAWFPARFQLVLAMNACPCGQSDRTGDGCTCTPLAKRRYAERVSAPIRDRIDLHREVRPLERHHLHDDFDPVEPTAVVAERVAAARERQLARLRGTPWRRNADVPGSQLRSRWPLPAVATGPLERMSRSRGVSARGVDRVLRVAWTLADLAAVDRPGADQVQLAVQLRAGSSFAVPQPAASRVEPAPGPASGLRAVVS